MLKHTLILILLLTSPVVLSASKKSLNEAVSEVKKQEKGQIISARTLGADAANQYHEIRVLTSKGIIKTIKVPAGNKRNSNDRQENRNYQSRSNQQRNSNSNRSNRNNAKKTQLKATSRDRTTVNRKRDKR